MEKKERFALLIRSYLKDLYGEREWFWFTQDGENYLSSLDKETPPPSPPPSTTITSIKKNIVPPPNPSSPWPLYLQKVSQCRICPHNALDTGGYTVTHDWRVEVKRDLQILFVTDFPRKRENQQWSLLGEEQEILLKKMAMAINIHEDKWALTLAVKCPPKEDLMDFKGVSLAQNCSAHLFHEICLLKPKIVVPFGAFATNILLGKKERLAMVHGQFIKRSFQSGKLSFQGVVAPLFHLDYLLINPQMKRATWIDLQKMKAVLDKG